MRDTEFAAWLEQQYVTHEGSRMDRHVRDSRISNCRRVEEYLGDLDGHWRRDRLESVIGLLTYSRADSGPKHRIPIAGNAYTGTATLKAATKLYAAFCANGESTQGRVDASPNAVVPKREPRIIAPAPRPLEHISTLEILKHLSIAFDELRTRGVMRTANNPVADYAEHIVAKTLGLTLLGNSTTGHDAVDGAGTRYEIKARRAKNGVTSHQLSAIRKLDERHFDILAAVIFCADFQVERAILVPWDVVKREATYVPHTNAWNLIVRPSLWRDSNVTDFTDRLREY